MADTSDLLTIAFVRRALMKMGFRLNPDQWAAKPMSERSNYGSMSPGSSSRSHAAGSVPTA